ncbi:hypothetical protein [Cellulomonas sp. KRMCY2]|uniref:hypothetical protein n=1 Tax=Cellulomonas sp. KRMCY2 TaxID=1304865 RepID=UPI0012DE6421|nr:hypothetical protein [Cellulomonas sp. KRMCY2]
MPVWVVKALAVGPGVVVSVVVVALTLAAVPAPTAAGAAVVLAALVAAAGRSAWEGSAARVVLGARRPRPAELEGLAAVLTQLCRVGLGPPLVELRVKRCRVIGATGAGRRTVVVSTGLIEAVALGDLPSRQAAALVAHSAVLVREGLTRADLLIGFASAPWRAIQATVRGVSSWGRRLPFTQAAWRLRAVVVAVAVVQAVQVGQVGLAVTIAAIGVFSYALPVWERRWHVLLVRAGDGGVACAGLGDDLVAFLRTGPRTDTTRARLRALCPSGTGRPALGLAIH